MEVECDHKFSLLVKQGKNIYYIILKMSQDLHLSIQGLGIFIGVVVLVPKIERSE